MYDIVKYFGRKINIQIIENIYLVPYSHTLQKHEELLKKKITTLWNKYFQSNF